MKQEDFNEGLSIFRREVAVPDPLSEIHLI